MHSIYNNRTAQRHDHLLNYFLMLSHLKDSEKLYNLGRYTEALEKEKMGLELSKELDVPHMFVTTAGFYISSKLKLLQTVSEKMTNQELIAQFYDLIKLYDEIKKLSYGIRSPTIEMLIFDLYDELGIFARAKKIDLRKTSANLIEKKIRRNFENLKLVEKHC